MIRRVDLIEGQWNPNDYVAAFTQEMEHAGAITTFVGYVRRDEDVSTLELVHYAPLTLPGMRELAADAAKRWELLGILMLHRIGGMTPGEPIVCVSAAAPHRRPAFEAVDFCMDHLKAKSWFWKRERRGNGWHWIQPRDDDYAALERWAR